MNVLTLSEFRKEKTDKVLELAPIKIISDGQPIGFFGKLEDFMYIGDLHPRVKIQLRAKEELARQGMPKNDIRVSYLEAQKETQAGE